jgi:tripeptidyl-peptidase I
VSFDGTSASSPSFAGFVALLNDARIAAGKRSLGFLNPLIYALNGQGFNDITAGNAPGCGTPGFNVSAIFCILLYTIMMLSVGFARG